MTSSKALLLAFGSTIASTVLGGMTGFSLGKFAPSYYRGIARGGDAPEFDPVAFGVGQGVTQGMSAGVAIGLMLVVILGWLESRTRANGMDGERPGAES
jgi:hypothetical protein